METSTGIRKFKISSSDKPFISAFYGGKEVNVVNVESTNIDELCTGDWYSFQLPNDVYVICNDQVYNCLEDIDRLDRVRDTKLVVSSEEEAEHMQKSVEAIIYKGNISEKMLSSYKVVDIRCDKLSNVLFSKDGKPEDFYNKNNQEKIVNILGEKYFRQRISDVDDNSYIFDTGWDGYTAISTIIGASESICGVLIKEEDEEEGNYYED